jgi:hypothetical protein
MFTLVSGNNLGLPFVYPAMLRSEYWSLQSFLWPPPSPNVFSAVRSLVTTRSRVYTTSNMAGFLGDIGMGDAVLLLRRAGTKRERRVSYGSAGGWVRWCAERGRAGGPQRIWSRGVPSPRRPPPSPPMERGKGGPATDVGREANGAGEGAAARSWPQDRRGFFPLSTTADSGEQFA